MKPSAIAAALAALVAGLWATRPRAAAVPSLVAGPFREPIPYNLPAQDMQPDDWMPTWEEAAGIPPAAMPPQHPDRAPRNVDAFLHGIRYAEGTLGQGGYGALFGWPRSGRSFDPYEVGDHPRRFFPYTDKAGKTVQTSAAGAYQITYTTWRDERIPFLAWAALNGYSTTGFLPATQDAFALYLLHKDGALDHVKAGRLAQAIAIARRRWASLPGAGYNQPERSFEAVARAYTDAGGTIA